MKTLKRLLRDILYIFGASGAFVLYQESQNPQFAKSIDAGQYITLALWIGFAVLVTGCFFLAIKLGGRFLQYGDDKIASEQYSVKIILKSGEIITLETPETVVHQDSFGVIKEKFNRDSKPVLTPISNDEMAAIESAPTEERSGLTYLINMRRAARSGQLAAIFRDAALEKELANRSVADFLKELRTQCGDLWFKLAAHFPPVQDEFWLGHGAQQFVTDRRMFVLDLGKSDGSARAVSLADITTYETPKRQDT